jgi:peptidoglycan biosynthesis protein MviN/MurJ (putative lipid II flippase)
MTMPFPPILLSLGVAALVLLGSWPIAQRLRHRDQRPFAAFLIFTSMLILVAAMVWWALIFLTSAILPPGALDGYLAGVVILLISLAAGLAAGAALVKRPPNRRMPR